MEWVLYVVLVFLFLQFLISWFVWSDFGLWPVTCTLSLFSLTGLLLLELLNS